MVRLGRIQANTLWTRETKQILDVAVQQESVRITPTTITWIHVLGSKQIVELNGGTLAEGHGTGTIRSLVPTQKDGNWIYRPSGTGTCIKSPAGWLDRIRL
jgi:hypothetical protein